MRNYVKTVWMQIHSIYSYVAFPGQTYDTDIYVLGVDETDLKVRADAQQAELQAFNPGDPSFDPLMWAFSRSDLYQAYFLLDKANIIAMMRNLGTSVFFTNGVAITDPAQQVLRCMPRSPRGKSWLDVDGRRRAATPSDKGDLSGILIPA
jgi:hypothetical protein